MMTSVRFITTPRRGDERLLWSRDIRFVRRLAPYVEGGRLLELETGTVLIAAADSMTDDHRRPGRRCRQHARLWAGRGRWFAPGTRPIPRRDVGGRPALRAGRQDRHGAVDPGRPDQDARLLLQPPEAARDRVPADRQPGRPDAVRIRSPVPADHADAAPIDQRRSSRRRSVRIAASSSTSTSWRWCSSVSGDSRRRPRRPVSRPVTTPST